MTCCTHLTRPHPIENLRPVNTLNNYKKNFFTHVDIILRTVYMYVLEVQASWPIDRGTQRQFPLKYLFGEAKITFIFYIFRKAKNFLMTEHSIRVQFSNDLSINSLQFSEV